MNGSSPRRFLGGAAVLAVLVAAFLVVGPSQVGGPATYAVISGTSMSPLLHRGDLAVVRTRGSYAVGDAVLYRSKSLDTNVLHRIKAREGGRLVMRGDNNGFDDGEKPLPSQVVGELWFHVPQVGAWLQWLQKPLHAALFLGVLVLFAMGGGGQLAKRKRGRPVSVGAASAGAAGSGHGRLHGLAMPSTILAGALGAAALFGLLAVLADGRAESRTIAVPKAYTHEGTFVWSADTWRSVVYPDGRVANGEPVFTRLVRRLDVRFDYTLASRERASVGGGVAIDAVVSDGTGWKRRLPVAPLRPFDGRATAVEGTLDVRGLVRLIERMRRLTGSATSIYSVDLEPRVEVVGYVGNAVVDDVFRPSLALILDNVSLRLDAPAAAADDGSGVDGGIAAADSGMTTTESHDGTRVESTSLSLGPVSLDVRDARRLGFLGVGASLMVAVGAAALGLRRVRPTDHDLLLSRHGDRIVDAHVGIAADRWVTELSDIAALVSLAERYDRVILHQVEGGAHVYVVDDGVAVYRCRGATRPVPSPRATKTAEA